MDGPNEGGPTSSSYVEKYGSYNPEKSRKSWAKATAMRKQQEEEVKNLERVLVDRRKNIGRYKLLLRTLTDEVDNLRDIIKQYEIDETTGEVSPQAGIELPSTTMAAVADAFNKYNKSDRETELCKEKLNSVDAKIGKTKDEIKTAYGRLASRIQQMSGRRLDEDLDVSKEGVFAKTTTETKTLQEIASKKVEEGENDSSSSSDESSSQASDEDWQTQSRQVKDTREATKSVRTDIESKGTDNEYQSLAELTRCIETITNNNLMLKEDKVKIMQKYDEQLDKVRKQLDESSKLLAEVEQTYNDEASKFTDRLTAASKDVSKANKVLNTTRTRQSDINKNREMALNHLKELQELVLDKPMDGKDDKEERYSRTREAELGELIKSSEKLKGMIEKSWECYTRITGEEYETVLANEINELSLVRSRAIDDNTADSTSSSKGIENEGILGVRPGTLDNANDTNESIINEGIMNESADSSTFRHQTHPVYISGLAVPPVPYAQVGDFLTELLQTLNYKATDDNDLRRIIADYMNNGKSNNDNTNNSSPKMVIGLRNTLTAGLSTLTTVLSSSASEISILAVRNSEITRRIEEIDRETEEIQQKLSSVLGEDEWRVLECVRSGEKDQEERKKALMKERNELIKELKSRRERFEREKAAMEQRGVAPDTCKSPKPMDIQQCTETLQNNKKITSIDELMKSINIVTQQRNLLSTLLLNSSNSDSKTSSPLIKQQGAPASFGSKGQRDPFSTALGESSSFGDEASMDPTTFQEAGNRYSKLTELQEEYLQILRMLDKYRLKVKTTHTREPVIRFSQTLPNTMTATNSRLNLNNPLIEYLNEFYELSNDLTNKRLFITMIEQYITNKGISAPSHEDIFLSAKLLSETLRELLLRKKELSVELIQVKGQIVSLNNSIDQADMSAQKQADINQLYEHLESRVEYPLSAISRIVSSYLPPGTTEGNISPTTVATSPPLLFAVNKPLGAAIAEYRASNEKLARLYKVILEEISNAAFKVVNNQNSQGNITTSPKFPAATSSSPTPHIFTPTYYHLVVKDPSIVVKGFNLFKAREKEMETLRTGDAPTVGGRGRGGSLSEPQIGRIVAKLHELDDWLKTANTVLARYNSSADALQNSMVSTPLDTSIYVPDGKGDDSVAKAVGGGAAHSNSSAQLLSLTTSFQNIEFILLSRLNKINNELRWSERGRSLDVASPGKQVMDVPDSVLLEKYLADSYGILNSISPTVNTPATQCGSPSGVSGTNTITNNEDQQGREGGESTGKETLTNPLTPVLSERSELNSRLSALHTERNSLIGEYKANQQTTVIDKRNIGTSQNQIDATRAILGCIQPLCLLEDIIYTIESVKTSEEQLALVGRDIEANEVEYAKCTEALDLVKGEMESDLAPHKTTLEGRKEIYESFKRQHEQLIESINGELKEKEQLIERNNKQIDELKDKALGIQTETKEAEEFLNAVRSEGSEGKEREEGDGREGREGEEVDEEEINTTIAALSSMSEDCADDGASALEDFLNKTPNLSETKRLVTCVEILNRRLTTLKERQRKLQAAYCKLKAQTDRLYSECMKLLELLDSELLEIIVAKNNRYEATRRGAAQRGNSIIEEMDQVKEEVDRASNSSAMDLLSSPPSAAAQRSFEKDVAACDTLKTVWRELTGNSLSFKKIGGAAGDKQSFTLADVGQKTEDNVTPVLRVCGLEDVLRMKPGEGPELSIVENDTFLRTLESSELVAEQLQQHTSSTPQHTLSLHPTPLFEKTIEVYTGKQAPQSRSRMSPDLKHLETELGETEDFPLALFTGGAQRLGVRNIQTLFHQFASGLFARPDLNLATQAKLVLREFGAFGSDVGVPCRMVNGLPLTTSGVPESLVVLSISADLRRMTFRNFSSGRSSFILCQELKELRVAGTKGGGKVAVDQGGEIVMADLSSSFVPPPVTVYFVKRSPTTIYTRNINEFLWLVAFMELMVCAAGVTNGIFRLRCFVNE